MQELVDYMNGTKQAHVEDGTIIMNNLLKEEMLALVNPVPNEDDEADHNVEPLSPEEAFRKVLPDEHPGHVKCGGRGATITNWYGSRGSSSQSQENYILEAIVSSQHT